MQERGAAQRRLGSSAAGAMSPQPQSRRDAARARAAERKLAEQAAARRARAAARYGMGPLRDRVVRPRTLQQYKKAVKDFYK